MIHSNTYKDAPFVLQNSTGIGLKLATEALPEMELIITADNLNDEDYLNSIQLLFETTVSFDDTVNNFVDRFSPGAPLPQVQLVLLLNEVDYSDYLVGQLNITWGEDSSGTCSFILKKIRPFKTIPVLDSDNEVKVGSEIKVSSVITLGDNSFTHKIFTGNIVSFDYDMWSDTVNVECLDNSFGISRLGNKISQEFYNLDPYVTDILSPVSTTPVHLIYRLNHQLDTSQKESLIGVWSVTDLQLIDNYLADQPRGTFQFKEDDDTTFLYARISLLTGTLLTAYNLNNNLPLKVRYAVSQEEQDKIPIVPQKKSVLLRQIAEIAGIENLLIRRENMPEDEIISVAVTANNEYPLDFIRKVIIPQTWTASFNEEGVLVIDREILRATPSRTYTDDNILENTLKLTQDLDGVINVQEVAGITVVQPSSGGSPTTSTNPSNKTGISCRHVLLQSTTVTSGIAYTMGKQASQTQLNNAFVFYHTTLNTAALQSILLGSKVYAGQIYFNIINNGNRYDADEASTGYTHFAAFGTTARPRIFLAPTSFKLYNSYPGFDDIKVPVVLQISGHNLEQRTLYSVSYSGLPSYAEVYPKCVPSRFATNCVQCGGGIYVITGSPATTFGIAISILRPFTYDLETGIVSVQQLNATLEIHAVVQS